MKSVTKGANPTDALRCLWRRVCAVAAGDWGRMQAASMLPLMRGGERAHEAHGDG